MDERVFFSTPTYDLDGYLCLLVSPGESSLRTNTRRVMRNKTLDGGVVVTDLGWTEGDRTITLAANNISKADEDKLWGFFEDYSIMRLSMADGFYAGAIERVTADRGRINISFLITERLSQ